MPRMTHPPPHVAARSENLASVAVAGTMLRRAASEIANVKIISFGNDVVASTTFGAGIAP